MQTRNKKTSFKRSRTSFDFMLRGETPGETCFVEPLHLIFSGKFQRVTAALCTIIVMHLVNRNRCQVFDTYAPFRGKHESNFSQLIVT